MKNILIILSIFVVVMLAYSDMNGRLQEIDRISKTQGQIELKRDILKPSKDRMNDFTDSSDKKENRHNNMLFNDRAKKNNLNNPQNKHNF